MRHSFIKTFQMIFIIQNQVQISSPQHPRSPTTWTLASFSNLFSYLPLPEPAIMSVLSLRQPQHSSDVPQSPECNVLPPGMVLTTSAAAFSLEMDVLLWLLLYKWKKCGPERLSNLLKVTQPSKGRIKIQMQAVCLSPESKSSTIIYIQTHEKMPNKLCILKINPKG